MLEDDNLENIIANVSIPQKITIDDYQSSFTIEMLNVEGNKAMNEG